MSKKKYHFNAKCVLVSKLIIILYKDIIYPPSKQGWKFTLFIFQVYQIFSNSEAQLFKICYVIIYSNYQSKHNKIVVNYMSIWLLTIDHLSWWVYFVFLLPYTVYVTFTYNFYNFIKFQLVSNSKFCW